MNAEIMFSFGQFFQAINNVILELAALVLRHWDTVNFD